MEWRERERGEEKEVRKQKKSSIEKRNWSMNESVTVYTCYLNNKRVAICVTQGMK